MNNTEITIEQEKLLQAMEYYTREKLILDLGKYLERKVQHQSWEDMLEISLCDIYINEDEKQ